MTVSRVQTYNIHNTPFAQLTCLEDAISKGYTVDDQRNKIESITVTSYPSLLFPALKNIRHDLPHFSTSHFERIALIYAISYFQEHPVVQNILDANLNAMRFSTDPEVLRSLDVVAKLDFCTPSKCDATTISILSWCREWINANCWALGLSKSQLCLYALLFGLSRYTFQNSTVLNDILLETAHFERYLVRKNQNVGEL